MGWIKQGLPRSNPISGVFDSGLVGFGVSMVSNF